MKTAKEMFEELGYTKSNYYVLEEIDDENIVETLCFIRKGMPSDVKETIVAFWDDEDEKNVSLLIKPKYIEDSLIVSKDFTLKELQAINQQVKELGWLE